MIQHRMVITFQNQCLFTGSPNFYALCIMVYVMSTACMYLFYARAPRIWKVDFAFTLAAYLDNWKYQSLFAGTVYCSYREPDFDA